ncbi:MAG: coproporphyrinogen dehydrogenase HemZ [Evtepia sp.]
MKIFLQGHNEKYPIEQMLMMLFPEERPEYIEEPTFEENELIITLTSSEKSFAAIANLRKENQLFSKTCLAHRSLPVDPIADTKLIRHVIARAFYLVAVKVLQKEPVWGMLSGVRPVKIPTHAMLAGDSAKKANQLLARYHVSAPRRRLAIDCADVCVAVKEMLKPNEISLYVGIPFCPSRCAYCSFISAAGHHELISPYLDALNLEIDAAAAAIHQANARIKTVYIGGGTPTTLSAIQLTALCTHLKEAFQLTDDLEFTLEAGRPDTITRDRLEAAKALGVNRISVNPQSMSDSVLKAVGRNHTVKQIREAFALARQVGFDAVNMDLIAGLPEDSTEGFRKTLAEVIKMEPENITVHTLALKRGAALPQTQIDLPTPLEVTQMLDEANMTLRSAGYHPYYLYRQKFMSASLENVGWMQAGHESVYNICMMEELHSVLALGAGGVTKAVNHSEGKVTRLANPKYPQDYIRDIGKICETKSGWMPFI